MINKVKFALFLAGVYVVTLVPIGAVAGLLWADLDAGERVTLRDILVTRASLFILAGLTMLGVCSFLLRLFFDKYITPALRLAEGTKIMLSANPAHRLQPTGGSEPQALALVINDFAAHCEALQHDVGARIREAQAKLEEEKNRLAALISELTQSVLVCNIEGRILLYNSRAKQLFEEQGEHKRAIGGASQVGLGRSVFGLFERSLITHALETVQVRLQKANESPVASFATAVGGQLIRVQMTPVMSAGRGGAAGADAPVPPRDISGFVLLMEDVTEAVEKGSRKDVVFHALTEASRRALASIRAAVETLLEYPEMEPQKQARFVGVINEEAAALSAKLEQTERDYAVSRQTEWLLEHMVGADLVSAACRRIESRLGMTLRAGDVDTSLWLRVDSFALIQALTFLAARLREAAGVSEVRLSLRGASRFAHLDLAWTGACVDAETASAWETQPFNTVGEPSTLTLAEVIERHDGEIWQRADPATGTGFFRLLLPVTQSARPRLRLVASDESRPEYYDFDLFHQAGQTPELDQMRLTDLTYSVFDTETTGLQPAEDEIVCIGAVRIVNGRLLHHEGFEQFVDPKRPMSLEAAQITGIDPSMLDDEPPIEQVLPQFHKYCEDTVLVAHNAAFDMRFLQLKQRRAGVAFTQPVLDTLLLSAVLHPNINANRLEALAERFGVAIIGRHTALGDAIMTGEIFLKMIPLLADKGILTLKDAREASERTYYARIKY